MGGALEGWVQNLGGQAFIRPRPPKIGPYIRLTVIVKPKLMVFFKKVVAYFFLRFMSASEFFRELT